MPEASSGPTSLHRYTRSRSPQPAPTLWEAGQVRTLVGIPVTLALPDLLNIHQGGICGGKEPPQTGLTLPLPRSDAGSWAGWKGPKVALREIPKPAGEMGVQAPHTRAGEWGVWVCRVGLTCRKKTNCASLPSLNPKGKRGGTGSKKSRWGGASAQRSQTTSSRKSCMATDLLSRGSRQTRTHPFLSSRVSQHALLSCDNTMTKSHLGLFG